METEVDQAVTASEPISKKKKAVSKCCKVVSVEIVAYLLSFIRLQKQVEQPAVVAAEESTKKKKVTLKSVQNVKLKGKKTRQSALG